MSMTKEELIARQTRLGWNNRQLAAHVRRTEQTVSNWRHGRQGIPDYVEALLDQYEQNARAAQRRP